MLGRKLLVSSNVTCASISGGDMRREIISMLFCAALVIASTDVRADTLSTTPNATNVTLGASLETLTDSATLSGGSNPTGTITFTLAAPPVGFTVDTETV